jgi:hypothetical protein
MTTIITIIITIIAPFVCCAGLLFIDAHDV